MRGKTKAHAAKDDYLQLIRTFPLTRIRDDVHLKQAHAAVEQLTLSPEEALSDGQRDYLEALSILVNDYEDKHHAIDTSDLSPVDMLRFLLEQNDMGPSDLGRLLGDRSLGTKILNGRRGLSQRHIAVLAERFAVSPSLFLKRN